MLPPITRKKYADRLTDLIRLGEDITISCRTIASENWVTRNSRTKTVHSVNWPEFVRWRTSCTTLLDQLVPHTSTHRGTARRFGTIRNRVDSLQFGIQFLKAIADDFDGGFLDDLGEQVEAEIAADYLGQAELLVESDERNHVRAAPAAVLAGAVLEKALRSICEHLSPPEATVHSSGKPLTLNPLIDSLRKREAFSEVMAKQLRAWAEVRNSAAHGKFNDFTTDQVKAMISGIKTFLVEHE